MCVRISACISPADGMKVSGDSVRRQASSGVEADIDRANGEADVRPDVDDDRRPVLDPPVRDETDDGRGVNAGEDVARKKHSCTELG